MVDGLLEGTDCGGTWAMYSSGNSVKGRGVSIYLIIEIVYVCLH